MGLNSVDATNLQSQVTGSEPKTKDELIDDGVVWNDEIFKNSPSYYGSYKNPSSSELESAPLAQFNFAQENPNAQTESLVGVQTAERVKEVQHDSAAAMGAIAAFLALLTATASHYYNKE